MEEKNSGKKFREKIFRKIEKISRNQNSFLKADVNKYTPLINQPVTKPWHKGIFKKFSYTFISKTQKDDK